MHLQWHGVTRPSRNRRRIRPENLHEQAAALDPSAAFDPFLVDMPFDIHKEMYSQALRREGRDSIFVMFRPWRQMGRNKSYRAPTLSLTDNISDVLSCPFAPAPFDSTKTA